MPEIDGIEYCDHCGENKTGRCCYYGAELVCGACYREIEGAP